MTGIYIHIPFCVKKCNYCAFLSFPAEKSPRKEYTEALINEIRCKSSEFGGKDIDTIYIGGGTPSVLDMSQLRDIMHAVRTSFNVKEDAEITLEANPGTLGVKDGVTLAKLQAYRYMGINRLSMGVQSMDNDRLHFMGRIHTAENVRRDMRLIRQKGFDNVNLDLIFSVPGSAREDALSDLRRITELGPEHISCYSLQMEEGTPFREMAESGEITEVSDEEDRETYHEVVKLLRESGYEHYEISNFARMENDAGGTRGRAPGFAGSGARDDLDAGASPYRSGHNSLYWNMDEYIGLGLGASGFAGGIRYRNTSDLARYLEIYSTGEPKKSLRECACDVNAGDVQDGVAARVSGGMYEEINVNTAFDNISEAVFTGLRRREGITYEEAALAYRAGACSMVTESSAGCPDGSETGTDGAAGDMQDVTAEELFWSVFSEARGEAEEFARQGLLIIDDSGLRLTEDGIDISNRIMSLFV